MPNAGRVLRTLAPLRPGQLGTLLFRRLRGPSPPRRRRARPHLRAGVALGETIVPHTHVEEPATFTFLGVTQAFPLGRIGWHSRELGLLWRMNLHYFDYVLDPRRSRGWIRAVIDDWIAHNAPPADDAWNPYAASLRIVNWIKLFLAEPALLDHAALESLYAHGLWLEANLERHLLANHYLKNAKALVFLGVFFDGRDAARWLRRGTQILTGELREQILADGGHYERSPMYHALVVEDLLDVRNLLASLPDLVPERTRALLETKTRAALDFLDAILLPDGEIPLFNDAAFGIAPRPADLFAYARRTIGYERPIRERGLQTIALAASGYYAIRVGDDALVIDCGEIGPPFQPGHAHADTLSYELALDARRIVVDTGVVGYEAGPERSALRATAAHNTVRVDRAEQSELWSAFRAGSRAHPIEAHLERRDGVARFTGAHDGFRRLPGAVVHRRTVEADGRAWRIDDALEGTGTHRLESFVHLHPDVTAAVEEDHILLRAGDVVARLEPPEDCAVLLEPSLYYPGFGARVPNTTIRFVRETALPAHLAYAIVREE